MGAFTVKPGAVPEEFVILPLDCVVVKLHVGGRDVHGNDWSLRGASQNLDHPVPVPRAHFQECLVNQ